MQVRSIHRGARISAFKCREVTKEIQGLPVAAALDLLSFTPKKAARLVLQVLKAAIANAENNNKLRADQLFIISAIVGEGPTMKRFTPRARGSASPILKRTSHIKIVVTDDINELPRRVRAIAESRLPKEKKSRSMHSRRSVPPANAKATSEAEALVSTKVNS
jgi:large subunit ribosomal protein L22